jgi:predicted PurR-regulated permease PerM
MTSSLRPPAEVPSPSPPQRRALGIIALVSVAALGYLALPVGSGLFFGTLLAFSLLRVYDRLSARLRNPGLAALLLALGSGAAIVGFLTLLVYSLVAQVVIAANSLTKSAESQGPLHTILSRVRELTQSSPLGPIDVAGRVNDALSAIAARLAMLPTAIAGATFSAILTLFFIVLTAFFVLRH